METTNTPVTPLSLSCPAIWNIVAPNSIKRIIPAINEWGWVHLGELVKACGNANLVAHRNLGEPQEPVKWMLDKGCQPLVRDFGLLMEGNLASLVPVYTYVLCGFTTQPKKEDFFLKSPKLPTPEDCMAGNVYVPAGWSTQVLKLVVRGIQLITFGDVPGNKRLFMHQRDGNVVFYKKII